MPGVFFKARLEKGSGMLKEGVCLKLLTIPCHLPGKPLSMRNVFVIESFGRKIQNRSTYLAS